MQQSLAHAASGTSRDEQVLRVAERQIEDANEEVTAFEADCQLLGIKGDAGRSAVLEEVARLSHVRSQVDQDLRILDTVQLSGSLYEAVEAEREAHELQHQSGAPFQRLRSPPTNADARLTSPTAISASATAII